MKILALTAAAFFCILPAAPPAEAARPLLTEDAAVVPGKTVEIEVTRGTMNYGDTAHGKNP